ncbi:MAG: NADH:flavin oxidoreductase [Rhodobacteraceae bacterium]|nr:NADH:flavin oxidoreductase [Paracoccaceae bacterium]
MSDSTLFSTLDLSRGPKWENRLALAPMTTTQSFDDGTLHDDELNWLAMRARGGFGMTMTCAIAVETRGRGYPGQLGAWESFHVPGLARLANTIKASGSVAIAQIAHSGPRSLENRVGAIDAPQEQTHALDDIQLGEVVGNFVMAAQRIEEAGFDGVELHAAHGFLPAQFLSPEINTRSGRWGGDLEGRSRFIREVLTGIRNATGKDFQLGLRLSPERFGLRMAEVLHLAEEFMTSGIIDWLDMSLWDVLKTPEEADFASKPLMVWFADLPRGDAKLGVAGNILGAADAERALLMGADFVLIGKAAILAHDFPQQVKRNPQYSAPDRPVTDQFLRNQGLGPTFIEYMRGFKGFVV